MKRIIPLCVLFISICLDFFACARPVQSVVIENQFKPVPRTATFADNMAAYVSVYCFWSGGVDGETMWDIMPGIVLDETHVLTTRCDKDVKEMSGWEESYITSITIGPFDGKNESGYGLWEAREVREYSEDSDLVIVAANSPLPLPSVVVSAKTPELGEILYTITSYSTDKEVRVIELLTVSTVDNYQTLPSETEPGPDFSVLMPKDMHSCCVPWPVGVFNDQHEFVGFVVGGYSSCVIPLKAPEKFKSGKAYGTSYDIGAAGKTLKSLLRQTNVSWSE